MRKTTLLLAAFLMFAFIGFGCKKDDNPTNPTVNPTVTGEWEGEKEFSGLATYNLKLNLVEANKIVAGSGTLTTESIVTEKEVIPIPVVAGTHNFPNITLNVLTYTFTGTVAADGKTITGSMTVPNPAGGDDIPMDIVLNKKN